MKCSATQIRNRIAFAAAVAVVAAVPGLAQADGTVPCPSGAPLQNTVNSACDAVDGVENSVRNGGTVPAVTELKDRETQTLTDLQTQQKQSIDNKLGTTTGNVGATKTATETGVTNINTAKDRVAPHVLDSETALEQSFVPTEEDRAFNCPVPKTGRPLADHAGGEVCSTVGGFATLIKVPTQAQIGTWLQNLIGLGGFRDAVTTGVSSIRVALEALALAEPGSLGNLVNAVLGNTDNAGSKTVTNVFEAAQCVRKGDYGDGARQTPCPR